MPAVAEPDETNDQYLDEFGPEDRWYQIILTAHRQLLLLDPDYTIDQIKEKFGGLRYYYSSELAIAIPEIRLQMDAVVTTAEAEVDALEAARRRSN